ncbi:MAG: methylated-DNA--[protein]-cysteine S-methyltransferase [Silvanigrellaceae bacterium]|nr:methylated-DNA--[protein]-cysteine S-methyltransferase [Silvanigrellaceae bacterium]
MFAQSESEIFFTTYHQPQLGDLFLLANQKQELIGLYFKNHKCKPEIQKHWKKASELPIFIKTQAFIHEYCLGIRKDFADLPIAFFRGTAFQLKVWSGLCSLKYGTTVSYLDLARKVGFPKAVRAVANSVGRNPMSIIVPCHRVIGANGALTGYAGGLLVKKAILELEKK